MRLVGRTVDIQALTRFMKDLEASPFLTNVQLDKSELARRPGKGSDAVPADRRLSPARYDGRSSRAAQPLGAVAMGLLPQNPRDQKLLVLALAIAGGAAVYQQMYWAPKNEELTIARVATRHARLAEQDRQGRSRQAAARRR